MASFGSTLRRIREERQISLDDVARETRLSKRYLVALEEETIGKLPGGTYNRAYLRIYATFLNLEAEPLLKEYSAEEERQSSAAEQDLLVTMNRAIDRRNQLVPGDNGIEVESARRSWGAAAIGLMVVLVLGGGFFWYASSRPTGTIETARLTEPATSPVASAGAAEAPRSNGSSSSDAPAPRRAGVERAMHDPDASHLSIAGSGVGTLVVDRQLVGTSDRFTSGTRVVFWTRVTGGRAGDTIDHVWLRDGNVVGAASLNIGSTDWRTQSRRVLDPSGDWAVEARDAEGRVLARHEFHTADE